MLVINGWALYAHPLFLEQIIKLMDAVEADRNKQPHVYKTLPNVKTLAAINEFVFKQIPHNPGDPKYRQGNTLGASHKHWFRAKFGNGRFRLFFRFESKSKVIIFAWVNDEHTLRTRGSKSDAYAVFAKMLKRGNPPDDWKSLLMACTAPTAKARWKVVQQQVSQAK